MRKKKEPFPPKEGAKEGTGMAPAWKVIRASESPLIDRSHEGSADNECGYENGYVIEDGRGTYHMLITEMFTRGTKNANGFVGEPRRLIQMYCIANMRYFFETSKGNEKKGPTLTSQDFANH